MRFGGVSTTHFTKPAPVRGKPVAAPEARFFIVYEVDAARALERLRPYGVEVVEPLSELADEVQGEIIDKAPGAR